MQDLIAVAVERRLMGLVAGALICLGAIVGNLAAAADVNAPVTKVDEVVDEVHGEKIADPYRWLEDQQAPATRAWIEEQNKYAAKYLNAFSGRAALAARCAELLKVDSISAPIIRGGKYFFSKRSANQDLPVIAVRNSADGSDSVLIDPATLSKDGTRTVSIMELSKDGSLLIYGVRDGGEDEVAVHFLDVATGKPAAEPLPKGRYFGMNLTPDRSTLFFTLHDKDTGSRVKKLAFGKPISTAETLFGEGYDSGVITSPQLSDDGRYLLLTVSYGSAAPKTDLYFADLQTGGKIVPLVNDVDARFEGLPIDHRVFVQTNWNAPNGRLLLVDLRSPARENWKEIVATGKGVISDVAAIGGKLFVNYLENVVSRVRVFEADGKPLREIKFPTLGTVSGVSGDWDKPDAFYAFSSFNIPTTIYRETADGAKPASVWFSPKVPLASDEYEVRQVFYKSKDGTQVPMFIACRKDLKQDGSAATLLYGYGGFNISLTPSFNPRFALWMSQGGVLAVANLRGGGELGEDWHTAGMLDRKQNVFDDFYAAADYLIAEKYTSSAKLGIAGGSNGGLLVGTAMTQRPDLFSAVVCSYPLLDMVRYHKFLVARFWIPEYGSSDDPVFFKYLKGYSPYHNVKSGTKYPAAMFVTGDSDTRVDPLHARKMAALVQASTGSDKPVLLKYDTKLGHTGARPVSASIDDYTDEISFLMMNLGLGDAAAVAPKRGPKGAAAAGADATSSTTPGSSTAPGSNAAESAFRALIDSEWEWTLREQPTFASHIGDYRYNDRWADVSLKAVASRYAHQRDVLKQLKAIDAGRLTAADQLNYELFRRAYESDVEAEQYRWYLIPLTQREGVQDESQLADSLRFNTVKDYEDWIARLRGLPKYIEQTTELMQAGVKERIVQPKITMQRIPAQIKRQIVTDPTESLYYKPFRSFPASISAADRERLQAAAKTAISDQVVPAYEKFLKYFEAEYLPGCFDGVGAWQAPRGQEFYAYRCRYFTTTSLSPDQIHEIGLKEVARIRGEMEKIIAEVGFKGSFAEFLEDLRTNPKFYYKDSNDLLLAYLSLCKKVDPQLTRLFKKLPRIPYGVEAIPEHIAPDTTTAYYRQPAADGTRAGTYFVNLYKPEARPIYEIEALSLHEAVPGHHLQIAISTELENVPMFRKFLETTVFVEGWALYAESLGSDLGCYRDPYSRFGQLTYEMWRAMRLVVDTGMHSKKWSREQAIDFFRQNSAKSELDIVNEVDRYISWPGQALAYKIGELRIKQLRAEAEAALGARFDIREFHDVVLGSGAIPLDLLEKNVRNWVRSRLATGRGAAAATVN